MKPIRFASPRLFAAILLSPLLGAQASTSIVHVAIPGDVTRASIATADRASRHRLSQAALRAWPAPVSDTAAPDHPGRSDRIFVLVDADGRPILPDRESARAAQRPEAGNELRFTFESPETPWSDAEIATLQSTLDACYPVIRRIYGEPAFDITVNIVKNPFLGGSAYYFPFIDEIGLGGIVTPDPLCHEVIHAFRDDNVIQMASFEEGMTRATEVEVFNQLPALPYWDRNHQYPYDVFYEALNRPQIGSRGGNFFYGFNPFLRYQLGGYAWGKALLENSRFMADFNRALYARLAVDPDAAGNEAALVGIAASVQPQVEGRAFADWYALQHVLNTQPAGGYYLYQRLNQLTVDFVYRDPVSGLEEGQPGATVDWTILDNTGTPIQTGSEVTQGIGWLDILIEPIKRRGRMESRVTTSSPEGVIEDRAQRDATKGRGCFGIVENADAGTVTFRALDAPLAPVPVDVIRGSFMAPTLAWRRGRFEATFVDPSGKTSTMRFNKDLGNYYLALRSL